MWCALGFSSVLCTVMVIGGLLTLISMVIAETAQRAAAEIAPEPAAPEGVRKEGLQIYLR